MGVPVEGATTMPAKKTGDSVLAARIRARRLYLGTMNEDLAERAWRLYVQGSSFHEIASEMSCTVRVATNLVARHRAFLAEPVAKPIPPRWAEAAALKASGLTYRAIGERFGVSAYRARELVTNYRRRVGSPTGSPNEGGTTGNWRPREDSNLRPAD